MGNAIHFKRPLTGLTLEQIRYRAKHNWFGRRPITSNKVVVDLVEKVEQLHAELTQARLDAEIYEAMYDTKCADCDKLLVKLEQAIILEALGNELHEERHAYVTKLEKQLIDIHRDMVWLWGFWDENTLIAEPGFEDDIRDAWDKLLAAVKGVE